MASDLKQIAVSILKPDVLLGLLSIISVITFPLDNFGLQPSFSSKIISLGNNGTAHSNCNCVVFRMDDIQDYWVKAGQLAAMDQFASRNQSLTLGLIMNSIGNDSEIVNKVKQGNHSGLFELAVHGWNHTDYTNMSEEEQRISLLDSNRKMTGLFGKASEIFIPPYDAFNGDTITAMKQAGIRIINGNESSFDELELSGIKNISMARSSEPLHAEEIFYIPSTIAFKEYPAGRQVQNSVQNIFDNATQNIEVYGYAVIVIHPQDFMKNDVNGNLTNELDENQISDLSSLIDLVLSNNIRVGTFNAILQDRH